MERRNSQDDASADAERASAVPHRRLINRKQLLAMVPLSDRTIYNLEKRGDFPRRIVLTSRNVAWDLDEIEHWIDARKRAARRIPAPGLRPPAR